MEMPYHSKDYTYTKIKFKKPLALQRTRDLGERERAFNGLGTCFICEKLGTIPGFMLGCDPLAVLKEPLVILGIKPLVVIRVHARQAP